MGGIGEALTALLDTNILIRHFTGEPKAQARRAGKFLSSGDHLVLTELVVAECVFVLSSVYKLPPIAVASLLRTTIGFGGIETHSESQLLRALELFADGHGFVDSFLVARAEESGAAVASFDKGIDKIGTVPRIA